MRFRLVRCDAVNAMLLNEFLKEHKAFLARNNITWRNYKPLLLSSKIKSKLTAGLQRVSADVQVVRPATQTILNRQ